MSSHLPPDPYQPPALIPAASVAMSSRRRPGWFVTICVISIALGATGFLHSLYALAELTMGDPLNAMLQSPDDGGDAEWAAIEEQMEQELTEIADRYYLALLPLALARLALTACLVLGGVGCLSGMSAARTLLIGTMAAAILFEIADTVVQTLVFSEAVVPLRAFGQAVDGQNAGMGAPPRMGETIMVVVMWAVMGVYYLCQASKGLFYLLGALYLRRASLQGLFQSSPNMADAAPT